MYRAGTAPLLIRCRAAFTLPRAAQPPLSTTLNGSSLRRIYRSNSRLEVPPIPRQRSIRQPQQRRCGLMSTAAAAPDGVTAAAAAESPTEQADGVAGGEASDDVILQYVVLRRDLWTELSWPLGSIVAQACHAATAALWESRKGPGTAAYCAPDKLDHMHKVVLEVKGETQLRNLAAKLSEAGVPHKLWVEQPEDFVTCLATQPAPKSQVAAHFKKLKLCKGV